MYCWSHGVVGHPGAEFKNKRPGHKSEATAKTILVGSNFGLPQEL